MIKVIQIGFGPVGQMITKYLLARPDITLVGVVDSDPQKVGKNIQAFLPDCKLNLTIQNSISEAKKDATVALLATASKLEHIFPSLEECARHQLHVVSTCEELIFPWGKKQTWAEKIDTVAKKHNISILGTGVNPGFLMDFLPVAMTGLCPFVKSIKIERIQDATTRRIPFQNKIGAGLTPHEFQEKVKTGLFGHVGLTESAQMIAHAMQWKITDMAETIQPVLSDTDKNKVLGIEQTLIAKIGSRVVIDLLFRASLGELSPRDKIVIESDRTLELIIPGAAHGDTATISMVINAAKNIHLARKGLVTMLDVPVTHAIGQK